MRKPAFITFIILCIAKLLFAQADQNPTTLYEWNVTNTGTNTGERVVATINSGTIGTYTGAAIVGQIIDGNGNWGYTIPIVANFKLFVNFSGAAYALQQDIATPGIILELKSISPTQVVLVANCAIPNRQVRVFLRYTNGTVPQLIMGNPGVVTTDGTTLIAQPTYVSSLTGRLAINVNTLSNNKAYALAVGGNAIAEGMVVKLQSGWSDYVFEPGYKLPPLADVKSYIDQNHHLPEIPSEQEVVKDGLNLGEMNKLLMKKVEELTLYLIENERKDKEKDKQLESMQKRITQLETIIQNKQQGQDE